MRTRSPNRSVHQTPTAENRPAEDGPSADALGMPSHASIANPQTQRDSETNDGYQKPERLRELQLIGGEHRVQMRPIDLVTAMQQGTQRPHELRLTAAGGWRRDAIDIGRSTPEAIVPSGLDRIGRRMPQMPAWRHRHARNLPFDQRGRFLSKNEIVNFNLVHSSATIQAALLELDQPPSAALSPLASVLESLVGRGPADFTPFHTPGLPPPHEKTSDLKTALAMALRSVGSLGLIDHVALEDKFGAAGGRALFDALMEAYRPHLNLQGLMHTGHLPFEPRGPHIPPTREEIDVTLAQNPGALEQLLAQSSIPTSLPHIDLAKTLVPEGAFEDIHLVAVQHVLGTQVPTFQAMIENGLDPANAEIVGVPYSTSYVTQYAMNQLGIRTDTPDVTDPNDVSDVVEAAAIAALSRALTKAKSDGKPILVMDDGGKASTAIAKHFAADAHLFRVVEQTTRGITELTKMTERGEDVPFPVVDVARSVLKRHETPKIGGEIADAVVQQMTTLGLIPTRLDSTYLPIDAPLAGKDVTVMGYGVIGQGVAAALRDRGANVTVFDIDPVMQAEAERAGFVSPPNREAALAGKALIVGATGHRSITGDDIEHLGHETVLASASSRDVEIDLSRNRDPNIEVVPVMAAGPGDTRFVTRVWRDKDHDVVVLRNGFPVNFNGAVETGTAESIQQTRAIMFLGAAQALTQTTAGVEPLSVAKQQEFATLAKVPFAASPDSSNVPSTTGA